jgi:hypothetical protein
MNIDDLRRIWSENWFAACLFIVLAILFLAVVIGFAKDKKDGSEDVHYPDDRE